MYTEHMTQTGTPAQSLSYGDTIVRKGQTYTVVAVTPYTQTGVEMVRIHTVESSIPFFVPAQRLY